MDWIKTEKNFLWRKDGKADSAYGEYDKQNTPEHRIGFTYANNSLHGFIQMYPGFATLMLQQGYQYVTHIVENLWHDISNYCNFDAKFTVPQRVKCYK